MVVQPETQESDGATTHLRKRPRWRHGLRGVLFGGLLAGGVLVSMACGVNDEDKLPPEIEDPSTLQTPNGALALYRRAVTDVSTALDGVVFTSGLLTDELMALPLLIGANGPVTNLDSRQAPTANPARLHQLRAQAREARSYLAAYAIDSSPALQAHMYALEGYAEVFLADLFCSGIPLSTVNFDGSFTMAAGSSTEEVYRHARALFDTALTLASDSVSLQQLAAVGRGRALLALGQFAEAAAAVSAVPDNYQYRVALGFSPSVQASGITSDSALFFLYPRLPAASRAGIPTMGNQEGGTGLDYRASNDPRTMPWTGTTADASGNRIFLPRKYLTGAANALPTSPVTFTMADGIEARLIEAEAALQADDDSGQWLVLLNQLRQGPACATIVPTTPSPCPLSSLTDPGINGTGIDPLRRDLLFRERAFWLYLTAHRQGDLRRLVRQYGRVPDAVYPTGTYPGSGGQYGNQVVVPMPAEERELNPNYTGCFHLDA